MKATREKVEFIDIVGGCGTGKTSTGGDLALALNQAGVRATHISTGHLYRALSLIGRELGINHEALADNDVDQILSVARKRAICFEDDGTLTYLASSRNGQRNAFDIADLKKDWVGDFAKELGKKAKIRSIANRKILDLIDCCNQSEEPIVLIFDGRGRNSERSLCFYFETDPVEAAHRTGKTVGQIIERDQTDQLREIEPLVVPQGSIRINNTHINQEDTCVLLMQYVRQERPTFFVEV